VAYKGDVKKLNQSLLQHKIIGGYDRGKSYPELKNRWLVALTEKRTKQEIDRLIEKVVTI
jgi:glycine dehydrogenase subunit 1